MNEKKIKMDFLFHLELFYRNFGNEWNIDDFPPKVTKHKPIIIAYLKELETLGIVELTGNESFIIKDLPSKGLARQ